MERKPLGRTGVTVPEIGVGTWKYRGGIKPLQRALELGATFIDTAEIYGTEDVVGRAIKGRRDEVFVATKVSGNHLRHDEVLQAAEGSLRRLGIDRIDLYQVHWPNPRIAVRETMQAMEKLVDEGYVSSIGVSNFSAAELREAQAAMTHHPIVSNQVLYNLNRRDIERELSPYCQQQHITIIAYTPLGSGALAGPRRSRVSEKMQVLGQVASEVQKTPAQVALNWCTFHPHVITIPKSNHAARVEENCGASGWRLTSSQMQQLNAAFTAA
jgi:diketogulonate reductase-like aldo/keto reductase